MVPIIKHEADVLVEMYLKTFSITAVFPFIASNRNQGRLIQ